MSALTFILQVLGYDDLAPTSNPQSRPIDYKITEAGIPVENAQTESFSIDPGATFLVFSGLRETSIDDSTGFNLSLSLPLNNIVYRLTYVPGETQAPNFRTARELDLSTIPLTLTLQLNLTLKMEAQSGTPFTGVSVGDVLFIPGPKTGDGPSPFNSLNQGFWQVISNGGSNVVLKRDPDTTFEGISEDVATSSADSVIAFSPDGVQVGDTVDLSAGFSPATLRAYDITAVTPTWVEFVSAGPLGEEQNITPGAAGIVFYTQRKRFIGIRTNQEIVVRYNGDTGSTNRVEPLLAGVQGMEGSDHKWGTVWSLAIVNRSSARAAVQVASAE